MTFDQEGHIKLSPARLFESAHEEPDSLIDRILIPATPAGFIRYSHFCDFQRAVSLRIGVHPRNLVLRGSCQIGFSIAPRVDKVWMSMDERSDLDLAIVDAAYYERIDQEVIRWEERTRANQGFGPAAARFEDGQRDRFYNCCRVEDLARHLCAHHAEAMEDVARMEHCGCFRILRAFIFRDWYSLRSRYRYDLRQLTDLVPRALPAPGDAALPRVR